MASGPGGAGGLSYCGRPAAWTPSRLETPRMFRRVLPALLAAGALFAATPDLTKGRGNWPAWRGPTGQGYVEDDRVPLQWGETENVLWKTKLPGAGNSTPIVWGDRVFLTAAGGRG